MEKNIYIINALNNKPLKIVFENNPISSKTEIYHVTLKELLTDILNENRVLRKLTTQQARSEKGKVRKGYFDEVINFLNKRGISREYIEKEIATERERVILNIDMNVSNNVLKDCKFGMIDLINSVKPIKEGI